LKERRKTNFPLWKKKYPEKKKGKNEHLVFVCDRVQKGKEECSSQQGKTRLVFDPREKKGGFAKTIQGGHIFSYLRAKAGHRKRTGAVLRKKNYFGGENPRLHYRGTVKTAGADARAKKKKRRPELDHFLQPGEKRLTPERRKRAEKSSSRKNRGEKKTGEGGEEKREGKESSRYRKSD